MTSTNWTKLRVAVVVISAGLTGSAFAEAPTSTDEIRSFQQMQKMPPLKVFKMIDTDKDGAVSREEFVTAMGKLFDRWDTNGDGKLSQEEWKEGVAAAKTGNAPKKATTTPAPRSE
ncbi:MAG TPA: EF-hand domain-containing protein [Anaeromyxobacteraceae bacterium]|nr:EF-hand domain-containing protein [Anaeromyxobacteraceae bacterium]